MPTDYEAEEIHGLSYLFDLMDKPRFSKMDADEINELLKGSRGCYAHNAAFDREVLEREFANVERPFIPWQKLECTQQMSRERKLP